jgi:hypothetical protein
MEQLLIKLVNLLFRCRFAAMVLVSGGILGCGADAGS